MSIEERKKRREKRKKRRIILIIVVTVYLIFRIIPTLYANNSKTVTVKEDILEITSEAKGILIKDEKVFKAQNPGSITLIASEGDRISSGSKVAQIFTDSVNEKLKEELNNIDKQLNDLNSNSISSSIFENDIEKNEAYIEKLKEEIKKEVDNGNYDKVKNLKEQLKKRLSKNSKLTGKNGYTKSNIEKLTNRRKELQNILKNSVVNYYSNIAGIVSYKIDGLEELYSIGKINDFRLDSFDVLEKENKEIVNNDIIKVNQPIFKIIDNFKWYIAIKVKKENILNLKENDFLDIRINGIDDTLTARVVKISNGDPDSILVLKLKKYLYKIYEKRYVDVTIINNSYKGLKIPLKSIIEKDGLKGVYIKDISGIIKFRPVKILGKDDKYAIVDKGNMYNIIEININGKNEKKRTLSMYDEVFLNTSRIKEGQLIN